MFWGGRINRFNSSENPFPREKYRNGTHIYLGPECKNGWGVHKYDDHDGV